MNIKKVFIAGLSGAVIVTVLTVWARAEPPSAGWAFGTDTYAQHDGSLIINSLSDRYGVSTFDLGSTHLGTNDYIEENGVKNTLALSGYTKAYDYNPLSTTGYGYSSVYNQPLPNVPLTKLTFMGLDGDPTKSQDVYVLTSEYNKLSDQGQATSIDSINASVNNQSLALAQTNVNLSNETNQRIAGDVNLQNQINSVNSQVNNLDNRVNNLERLKVMPEADIRFFDSKYVSAMAYDAYDATNGRNFAVGVKVVLKIGKSYEETLIEKQNKEIGELKVLLMRMERMK